MKPAVPALSPAAARPPRSRQAARSAPTEQPADGNKGTAIVAMMKEPAFAHRQPVFIGDDVTDEYGFAAVGDLGGAGILVGPERETAAAYRLKDVDHVHRWLARACEALA